MQRQRVLLCAFDPRFRQAGNGRNHGTPPRLPPDADEPVMQDGEQPGPQAGVGAAHLPPVERAHEAILDEVVRAVTVAAQCPGKAAERRDVQPDQLVPIGHQGPVTPQGSARPPGWRAAMAGRDGSMAAPVRRWLVGRGIRWAAMIIGQR